MQENKIISSDAQILAAAYSGHIRASARAWFILATVVFLTLSYDLNSQNVNVLGLSIQSVKFEIYSIYIIFILNILFCIRHLWVFRCGNIYIKYIEYCDPDQKVFGEHENQVKKSDILFMLYESPLDRVYPLVYRFKGKFRDFVEIIFRVGLDLGFILFPYAAIFYIFNPIDVSYSWQYIIKLIGLLVNLFVSSILIYENYLWTRKFFNKRI